jgi:antitoxin component YwqK of YwqJK toxin-antitoxin module
MEPIKSILTLIIPALIVSCGSNAKRSDKKVVQDARATGSFEVYAGDTVNRIDVSGRKQGLWVTRNLARTKKLEEGNYVDNRKEGFWKRYSADGKLIDSILYKRDEVIK